MCIPYNIIVGVAASSNWLTGWHYYRTGVCAGPLSPRKSPRTPINSPQHPTSTWVLGPRSRFWVHLCRPSLSPNIKPVALPSNCSNACTLCQVSVDSSRAPLKLPQAPSKYTKINRDVAVEERESGHCGQVRQTFQGENRFRRIS